MKECSSCRRCFADEINHCPDDGVATTPSIVGEPVLDSRYQLERRLGHGGMGVVFQARHIFLKTAHAIKIILPDLVGNDPMLVTRFRQEALAAAAIRHPNIIAVTDFGVVRGVMPFLVMEYVKGLSLQDMLAAEGRMSPQRAFEIISAVAAGVGAAHRQNIVHRDLKPLNIMVQEGQSIAHGLKVLDFGLAKIKSGELLGSFVQAKTSGLMGSPFYMAPEQWSDEEPDVRADIYSIGVITFQMLAGEVPFRGNSIPAIMKKHLTSDPPFFASFDVSVPQAVEKVVHRALAKDPGQRPASVEEFVSEMQEAVTQPSTLVAGAQTLPFIQRETLVGQARHSGSLPAVGKHDTKLFVHSFPPASRVFINNISVGATNEDGVLVLNEMLRGEHEIVVLHEGFQEWSRKIDFPGGECHVEARLDSIGGESQLAGTISGTIGASSLSDAAFSPDTEALERERREAEERERLERERDEKEVAERKQAAAAEAARLKEAEEVKRKEEEAARLKEAEDARRKEEEAARLKQAEEIRRKEEEAARLKQAEDARRKEEEVAKRKQLEEATRREEAAAAQKKAEEEAARLKEAKEARRRAEQEAARKQAEEAQRLADLEAKQRAEAEAESKRKAEREAELLRLEEERQARRQQAELEAAEAARKNRVDLAAGATLSSMKSDIAGAQLSNETQQFAPGTLRLSGADNRQGTATQQESGTLPASKTPSSAIATTATRKASLPTYIIVAVIGCILVLGLGTYFVVRMTRGGGGSTKLPLKKPTENKPPNTKPTETQPASTVKAEMVALPGGTFLMGREKGLPQETPAHSMTVAPFWMDRTEVTNSEYSQFVSETNYKAPASWSNNQPPQGQEQWPVSNVSFEDATAFAAWRSKRDGVTYRLPTEEEWEYAARSGADDDLYPWGNAWKDEYANLGTKVVKPAGSFPAGKNKWGNLDLIGNVWEWTSSKIALYPGNHNEIPVEQRGWIVIRGGSYSSDATGPKAVTTVTRQWVEPSRRDALLGIRLVRSGS